MIEKIKQMLTEDDSDLNVELLDEKTKVNKRLKEECDDELSDNDGMNKVKLVVWAIALLSIVPQVIFLGWWTILTGLVTCVIAYYVAELLVNAGEYLELMREYRAEIIVWVFAVVLIVVQIFTLGWWTILTGFVTILLAIYLPWGIRCISDYFRN